MRAFSIAIALVVAAVGPLVSTVRAQSTATRAIVLTFEGGRRGDTARDAAIAELASHVELVTEDQAVATAQSMGIDVSTPEGLAEVVREPGAAQGQRERDGEREAT